MQVLVTRPKGKGESLVRLLTDVVDGVHQQSVIEIKSGPDLDKVSHWMDDQPIDIMIFVSGFAVEYFIRGLKTPLLLNNSSATVYAVGQSTANKLQQWTTKTVVCPNLETSEGLLALTQLQAQSVNGKNIVIVRGVGGRELLAEQLQSRGAMTCYWQLYQRVPLINQGAKWFSQWQSWKINCMVITSVAILTTIVDNLPAHAHCWLKGLKWIVASERIAAKVQALGIESQQIYDAKGASDSAVLAQVKRIIEK